AEDQAISRPPAASIAALPHRATAAPSGMRTRPRETVHESPRRVARAAHTAAVAAARAPPRFTARCGGLQKESRPKLMSQEMSQMSPMVIAAAEMRNA